MSKNFYDHKKYIRCGEPSFTPAVEHAENFFSGDHFKNSYLIAAQHILPSTHMMIRSMINLGLDANNIAVIGKCYSSDEKTMEAMIKEGIFVCKSSIEFDSDQSFDQQFKNSVEKFLYDQIKKMQPAKDAKIIILDDGGSLIIAAQDLASHYSNICGVEQTSSGYHRLVTMPLKFPVINVSQSRSNLDFETPLIAKSITDNLKKKLSISSISPKDILIVGSGAIGNGIYEILKSDCTQHNIMIYDSQKELSELNNLDFSNFDIIIGATGNKIMSHYYYDSLRERAVLVNVSSSDREFDAVNFRKLSGKKWNIHDDVYYNGLCLLNCGFPINFSGSGKTSVPLLEYQLFMTMSFLGVCERDKLLSEAREHNIQLMKKSEELQKALAIKTDFLNNLSHEVRTPINGVVNLSELLLETWHKSSDDERYKNMKIVAQSGKRLLMVMNSILDLSKFTSGKMSMNMSEGNLEESVREMISECESLYIHQRKDIVIETNIQPGIDSVVMMDEERIAQVLRNLVDNAVKFTKAGKIKISLRSQGKNLEVIVEDEGVGIPEDELEEIFNPFVQSSKTKNNAGGTGLGLSICKEIITAHNGKIWAVNKIVGASFHFIIPRARNIETPTPQLKSKIADKPSQQTKGTALMIDDDELCHNIISMILKNDRYEMISTYSGTEGLEYLHQHYKEIDFIFLDLMMPHMNGLEVLKKIKSEKHLAHIPAIIQSASSNNDDYNKAIELGAIGFFAKPYEYKNILKFLDNLVEEETT